MIKLKIYIFSEDGAPWTLMPKMGHHGRAHSAPEQVHCTPEHIVTGYLHFTRVKSTNSKKYSKGKIQR